MIHGTLIDLRAIEDDDVPALHRWFNDPEVTRFLGANAFPALSLAQERAFVERLRDVHDRHNYAIVLKDGSLIGVCELRTFDQQARSCELGIAIGEKEYWGKGYGGAAVIGFANTWVVA